LSAIQRDLASTELWHESFERSLRRRALAPIARKREARRKRTSLVAGAAVATAPMLPSLGAADAASSHGTHEHANSHRLQNQAHERILLRRGDENASVGALQRALKITADDIFGPQTEAAVRTMQERDGLPATGKVDARTWLTLFPHDAIIAVTGATPPGSSRSAQPTAQWAAVTVPSVPHADSKAAAAGHTTRTGLQAAAAGTSAALATTSYGSGSGGVRASLIGAAHRETARAPESAAPLAVAAPAPATPAPTSQAPTTVSLPGSTGGQTIQIQAPTPGSAQTAAEMVAEMLAAADAIDAHHYAYRWGGGHNASFSGPYDCSGAVSAVLHAAGLVSAPMVSGDYMRWGAPGPGTVTIYANAGHVYMSINGKFFGTSYANPGGGAGWYQDSARPGFVVIHVPFEKMHLRTTAARVQAARARRQQRRQPTAVAAVQPRKSGSAVAPAAETTTGNGGTAYVGASAPTAAQPQSGPVVGSGAPTTVAPSADAPATVAPSADAPATVAPSSSTPATVAPAPSTPTAVAPAASTPATVAPAPSTPTAVAPASDAPASVAPSSSVPAPAPSPTPDVAPAPAPASAPETTSPTAAAPAPSTVAPAPTASAPSTAPSSVDPASAVTPTPPATQPAAPADPPTGDATGTPATGTAAPAADPGAQSQASAPATSTSDASASAPAASASAPATAPAAA
jgi:hypothetical protein